MVLFGGKTSRAEPFTLGKTIYLGEGKIYIQTICINELDRSLLLVPCKQVQPVTLLEEEMATHSLLFRCSERFSIGKSIFIVPLRTPKNYVIYIYIYIYQSVLKNLNNSVHIYLFIYLSTQFFLSFFLSV